MGLIATLVIGLIVGAVAKLLVPGRDPGGWIITILLGIAGAIVGTWLGRMLGLYSGGESAGWIASIVGAVLLLLLYRAIVRGKRSPGS
ncbi:MAG: GlsB/YeaQ/YmgE family stress response membrane protein [Vicinamibacterales bacterium]